MPSNQKTFYRVNEHDLDLFRSQLRSKGYAPPSGDTGLLRGGSDVFVDWSFDQKAQTLALRLRQFAGDARSVSTAGNTPDAIFRELWQVLSNCASRASENP